MIPLEPLLATPTLYLTGHFCNPNPQRKQCQGPPTSSFAEEAAEFAFGESLKERGSLILAQPV